MEENIKSEPLSLSESEWLSLKPSFRLKNLSYWFSLSYQEKKAVLGYGQLVAIPKKPRRRVNIARLNSGDIVTIFECTDGDEGIISIYAFEVTDPRLLTAFGIKFPPTRKMKNWQPTYALGECFFPGPYSKTVEVGRSINFRRLDYNGELWIRKVKIVKVLKKDEGWEAWRV